jgi:hypothetical protein
MPDPAADAIVDDPHTASHEAVRRPPKRIWDYLLYPNELENARAVLIPWFEVPNTLATAASAVTAVLRHRRQIIFTN